MYVVTVQAINGVLYFRQRRTRNSGIRLDLNVRVLARQTLKRSVDLRDFPKGCARLDIETDPLAGQRLYSSPQTVDVGVYASVTEPNIRLRQAPERLLQLPPDSVTEGATGISALTGRCHPGTSPTCVNSVGQIHHEVSGYGVAQASADVLSDAVRGGQDPGL